MNSLPSIIKHNKMLESTNKITEYNLLITYLSKPYNNIIEKKINILHWKVNGNSEVQRGIKIQQLKYNFQQGGEGGCRGGIPKCCSTDNVNK